LKLKRMCCWVNFLPNTLLLCSILLCWIGGIRRGGSWRTLRSLCLIYQSMSTIGSKLEKPCRIDSAVDAFHVMYQHFDNVVTWKIQERRSSAAATIRAMERSRQRRPLPNNFMFTMRMVSGRQRLLVFGRVTHLLNCLSIHFLFCRGLTSLVQVVVMRWLSS